jgi:hypothetical protein
MHCAGEPKRRPQFSLTEYKGRAPPWACAHQFAIAKERYLALCIAQDEAQLSRTRFERFIKQIFKQAISALQHQL